jgi:hypothetical protein
MTVAEQDLETIRFCVFAAPGLHRSRTSVSISIAEFGLIWAQEKAILFGRENKANGWFPTSNDFTRRARYGGGIQTWAFNETMIDA